MSFAELKEQVAGLTVEERFRLSAFLADLELEKEAEFQAAVERRMCRMDAGDKVTMEQFEARHEELRRAGR